MVTVETAGIITGVYVLFSGVVPVSGVGDAGDSMIGEAGDSKVGEVGESIVGEAGDSTSVNFGGSIIRCDGGSNSGDAGESISGGSGGACRGESAAYFFQDGSCLSLDTNVLAFFLLGSPISEAGIWPM